MSLLNPKHVMAMKYYSAGEYDTVYITRTDNKAKIAYDNTLDSDAPNFTENKQFNVKNPLISFDTIAFIKNKTFNLYHFSDLNIKKFKLDDEYKLKYLNSKSSIDDDSMYIHIGISKNGSDIYFTNYIGRISDIKMQNINTEYITKNATDFLLPIKDDPDLKSILKLNKYKDAVYSHSDSSDSFILLRDDNKIEIFNDLENEMEKRHKVSNIPNLDKDEKAMQVMSDDQNEIFHYIKTDKGNIIPFILYNEANDNIDSVLNDVDVITDEDPSFNFKIENDELKNTRKIVNNSEDVLFYSKHKIPENNFIQIDANTVFAMKKRFNTNDIFTFMDIGHMPRNHKLVDYKMKLMQYDVNDISTLKITVEC